MEINKLIKIIKEKLNSDLRISSITIEDKSFLHSKHTHFDSSKFHIKLVIDSPELKCLDKITANRKIYEILKNELKTDIHSLQIIIN